MSYDDGKLIWRKAGHSGRYYPARSFTLEILYMRLQYFFFAALSSCVRWRRPLDITEEHKAEGLVLAEELRFEMNFSDQNFSRKDDACVSHVAGC